MERDPLTRRVIGCAIEVHRALGPGLLESTYQCCLAHELSVAGLECRMQHPVPVIYKQVKLQCGYRIDILVEDQLLLELKSVDRLAGVHQAQVLTYMKLADIHTGLLINFNVDLLIDGVRRFKL